MTDYRSSFENELPTLKTEEERKAVKAAVLRFITEIRQQILEITTQNNTKVVTGEISVNDIPYIILNENPNRKVAHIKNMGESTIKIFGIDDNTTGGFTLGYHEQVTFHGTNSIQVATLSGVSLVNYLDS